MTVLVAGAAYLLITQLAEIGFGTIFDELRQANLAWVGLALILAQLAVVGSGIWSAAPSRRRCRCCRVCSFSSRSSSST